MIKEDNSRMEDFKLIRQQIQSSKIIGYSLSFAFNQNSTILFVGQQKQIKLYGFQNRKKRIQILNKHQSYVGCLIFMKKSNQLISGSHDASIIVWKQNFNNVWKPDQILKGHLHYILCLIANDNEDLLISGGYDKTIKFWSIILNWSCVQTIEAKTIIYSLSLNPSNTKLIFCGFDGEIQVYKYQLEKKWCIIQTIKTSELGYRLCFINDNQFVFQPLKQKFLEIYSCRNNSEEQFINIQYIQVFNCENCCCFFPSQFIQKNKVLIVKNGYVINIFVLDQNGECIQQEQIKYKDISLSGRLTEDGKFLVVWDKSSEAIQIRKLNLRFLQHN